MLDFQDSLDGFLSALFTFLNDFLNALFGWLTDLFSGITIT